MKTLYVSDLDGTLLHADQHISKYSLDTINTLIKSGMLFSYATARSIHSASIVTRGLELEIPVVTHNGVFVIDTKTRERIIQNSFSAEEVRLVSGFLKEKKISPLVYSFIKRTEKVSWLSGKENTGILAYLNSRKGDRRLRETHDIDSLYNGEVFYFTCIGGEGELLPVYDHFHGQNAYNVILQQDIYRPEYWCEIMPKKATKAKAVLQMKKLFGCGWVVSFGDGINDIPLFEISDECYAMANAVPELKEIATGIIDTNDNDGVARWLAENVNLPGYPRRLTGSQPARAKTCPNFLVR